MPKQDEVAEEKTLTFKTLSVSNMEQVSKFIVRNHKAFNAASEEERARLYSISNSIMIPALQSEWSFGICCDRKLDGVYLSTDLLNYLKISKVIGEQTLGEVFEIGQFEDYFKSLIPEIKRGDYIVTFFNALSTPGVNTYQSKELALIQQGFYMMKIGGWKNALFQTNNPIPFLKIGAMVVVEGKEEKGFRSYLMNLNMSDFCLTSSPFSKIYARL